MDQTAKALQRHQERLQRALRTTTGQRVEIVSAASLGLTVSPDVAAFAVGLSIVIARPIEGEFADLMLNSLVCHEAAHLVQVKDPRPVDLQSISASVSRPWREWEPHAGPMAFRGHESPFLRMAIHIRHRLASQGFATVPEWVVHHKAYKLAALKRYTKALSDEPERLSWVPLCEVLNRQAPESFRKLWADDVVRSVKRSLKKGS